MKYFLPLLMTIPASASASNLDWRLSLGAHDFQVQSSDTFGSHAEFGVDYLTKGGLALHASINTYFDLDKDKLDPDHIPVWFQSNYFIRGDWRSLSQDLNLDWQVDLRGKRNTVSSVETLLTFHPSLGLNYAREAFGASARLGIGYHFLEIDDDVPKERGYVRGEFANDALAWMTDISAYVMLAPDWKLSGGIEYWADGTETLDIRYRALLDVNTPWLRKESVLTFSIDHTYYNLDPYDKWPKGSDNYLPILPWDTDTMYRLYWTMSW